MSFENTINSYFIQQDSMDFVKDLLSSDINYHAAKNYFYVAVENNSLKSLSLFLKDKRFLDKDITNKGILKAIELNYIEVIQLMIEARKNDISNEYIDFTYNCCYPIISCVQRNRLDIGKLIFTLPEVKKSLKIEDKGIYDEFSKMELEDKVKRF